MENRHSCKHCNYEWNYNGNSIYYVTCPRCLCKVKSNARVSSSLTKVIETRLPPVALDTIVSIPTPTKNLKSVKYPKVETIVVDGVQVIVNNLEAPSAQKKKVEIRDIHITPEIIEFMTNPYVQSKTIFEISKLFVKCFGISISANKLFGLKRKIKEMGLVPPSSPDNDIVEQPNVVFPISKHDEEIDDFKKTHPFGVYYKM